MFNFILLQLACTSCIAYVHVSALRTVPPTSDFLLFTDFISIKMIAQPYTLQEAILEKYHTKAWTVFFPSMMGWASMYVKGSATGCQSYTPLQQVTQIGQYSIGLPGRLDLLKNKVPSRTILVETCYCKLLEKEHFIMWVVFSSGLHPNPHNVH